MRTRFNNDAAGKSPHIIEHLPPGALRYRQNAPGRQLQVVRHRKCILLCGEPVAELRSRGVVRQLVVGILFNGGKARLQVASLRVINRLRTRARVDSLTRRPVI